jgi:hypothetical protein
MSDDEAMRSGQRGEEIDEGHRAYCRDAPLCKVLNRVLEALPPERRGDLMYLAEALDEAWEAMHELIHPRNGADFERGDAWLAKYDPGAWVQVNRERLGRWAGTRRR